MITYQEIRENFDYCPETGMFRRKFKSGKVGIAGCLNDLGYIVIGFNHKVYKAHRLAWLFTHGSFPNNEIDHINGNKNDNRLSNLRAVTKQENSKNKLIPKSNTSGVMGVFRDRDKWVARIVVDKKPVNLGRFTDKKMAAEARKDAEVRYDFHPNHGSRYAHPRK